MAEDPTARVDRLEKAHLELQEQHAKSCDNISQMMEMLTILSKEKQSAEIPNTQTGTTPLGGTSGDTPYPQGFALPRETQATYASPSQPFPFNYRPPQVMNTSGLVMQEPKEDADPVDPLAVPHLDELVEKEKSLHDKAIEKYELLEERMRQWNGSIFLKA